MFSACVLIAFALVFGYVHTIAFISVVPPLRKRVFESTPRFKTHMTQAPAPLRKRAYTTSKRYDHHFLGV